MIGVPQRKENPVALIDQLPADAPQCWRDLYNLLDAGIDRIILTGPPGTGKTFAGLTIGDSVDRGAKRLICTEDMTDFDIVGGFMPAGERWDYHEGQAIQAWNGDGLKGGRLVIDEVDRASGDVLALLLAITDSADSAKWTHPQSGKTLKPKDGFSVIMTTNVEDPRDLPEALVDRFPAIVHIDRPHPAALQRLPHAWRGYADRMANAGENRISLRKFYDMLKLVDHLGLIEAARIMLGDKAEAFIDAVAIDGVNDDG